MVRRVYVPHVTRRMQASIPSQSIQLTMTRVTMRSCWKICEEFHHYGELAGTVACWRRPATENASRSPMAPSKAPFWKLREAAEDLATTLFFTSRSYIRPWRKSVLKRNTKSAIADMHCADLLTQLIPSQREAKNL